MKNLDELNFGTLTPIDICLYCDLNKIACGDIDNDGDIDIIATSWHNIGFYWYENDGTGSFSYQIIAGVRAYAIILDDINKDGYLDIISAGNDQYDPETIFWIKNTNGEFSEPILIDDYQSAQDLFCADINNDGLNDIVGVSSENYSPYDEKLFYYLGNDSGFNSQIIIDNRGTAATVTRKLYIADLNNDCKPDITTSYYFFDKVNYYTQTYPTTTIDTSICQGNSYFAEGSEQTISGAYYDLFPDHQGCDSIIMTNLTVIPTQVTNGVAICQGSSYFAGGSEQTEPGVYYDTLQNSLGCDSIIITNLSVDECTGINILNYEQELFLFPNPAHDYLNIILNDFNHIQFFDQTGQLIYESDKNTICVTNLREGFYFVKIFDSKNAFYMKKIVIIR